MCYNVAEFGWFNKVWNSPTHQFKKESWISRIDLRAFSKKSGRIWGRDHKRSRIYLCRQFRVLGLYQFDPLLPGVKLWTVSKGINPLEEDRTGMYRYMIRMDLWPEKDCFIPFRGIKSRFLRQRDIVLNRIWFVSLILHLWLTRLH